MINIKKLINQIFITAIVILIIGIIKAEIILNSATLDNSNLVRIGSYTTLGIGTFFFSILLILSVSASHLISGIFKEKAATLKAFKRASTVLIYTFLVGELSKFIITVIYSTKIKNISSEVELVSIIGNESSFKFLNSLSDILFASIGIILFILILKKNDENLNYSRSIAYATPFVFCFLVMHFV
ncbi:hypothetical protein [Flagellimonas onchidii]|uniref:hypothetical protein n=1 Tax=Flagellimonas onchidii TaxID=2562684 RepID=UPI0010A5D2B5|nr:hypothetical protein [Allomuricauda onchidii]